MFSIHDLTKNVIDLIKKPNPYTTNQKYLHGNKLKENIFVTVLIAQSKLNVLNLQRFNFNKNSPSNNNIPINHLIGIFNVINCFSDQSVFKDISENLILQSDLTNSIINMEASLTDDADGMFNPLITLNSQIIFN